MFAYIPGVLMGTSFLATLLSPSVLIVSGPPALILETKPQMEQYLKKYAGEKKVPYQVVHDIITCESNWDADVQSHFVYKGVREESHGLVQINLPSHQDVTKAQANNPKFAIEFLVDNYAKGNADMWSCYKPRIET